MSEATNWGTVARFLTVRLVPVETQQKLADLAISMQKTGGNANEASSLALKVGEVLCPGDDCEAARQVLGRITKRATGETKISDSSFREVPIREAREAMGAEFLGAVRAAAGVLAAG